MKTIRLGIVGLGLGQWQVSTVKDIEGAEVVAVADNNPTRLKEAPEEYARKHGATFYSDGVEMMDKAELDAVSLCISPKWRRPLLAAAGERGIPMLVEKPWASNVEHGCELAEICAKYDVLTMVEFPLRFMPSLVRVRELMDAELGKGWMANGNLMMGWNPPAESWHWDQKNGGGLINECYVHLLDTLSFFLGKPKTVFASGGSFRGRPLPDAAAAVITFEGGASGALTCGGIGAQSADGGNLLEIWTENGMARISGKQWLPDTVTWATRSARKATTEKFHAPERLTIMEYSMRAFFDCIQNESPSPCTVEDGQIATAAAMSIHKSIESGKPVEVSW